MAEGSWRAQATKLSSTGYHCYMPYSPFRHRKASNQVRAHRSGASTHATGWRPVCAHFFVAPHAPVEARG